MIKATSNQNVVISISVDKKESVKGLLKLLTKYIQNNL